MYSYHRVLSMFGRSVNDPTRECDCDIHPWEIDIDGASWPGKIRLIGFVDCFFLFSYSANARFERGIVVYKDSDYVYGKLLEHRPNAASELNATADVEGKDTESKAANDETSQNTRPPCVLFTNAGRYIVKGWGHEIALKTNYPQDSIRIYEVRISKPYHRSLRRGIKRGIREHTTKDLLEDLVRCGFIAQGQMTGQFLSQFVVGGVFEDTIQKYLSGLSGGRPGNIALANEATG